MSNTEEDHNELQVPEATMGKTTSINVKSGVRISRANGEDIHLEDLDGENIVMTQDEFNSMVRNISVKGERVKNLRRYLGFAAVLIFTLAVVSFAMSWLAAEASKESHVDGTVLVNTQNEPVQVASSDFTINDDGMMIKQCNSDDALCNSRRLSDTADISLKTTPTKHQKVLASSLSDEYLMSLTEVVVYSDKGHTLRISVHGFARVPVLNSRCGNIVHLYTAWNGRLSLDSTDLSFDEATEASFLNAGFSLAVGGVSGRRLTSQHSVEGFFTAVQGLQDSESWDCTDVPLPTVPPTLSQTMAMYTACAVSGAVGDQMDPCDSKYGGVLPGVHTIAEKHQLATMTKTARIQASLSVDVPLEQALFVKSELEILKTPTYQIQQTQMANHPGQVMVSVYNRNSREEVTFQLLNGTGERYYCNSSSGDMTPLKREQEAADSGIDTEWHFEFLDLVEEDGIMLRHFRMVADEAFLTWMSAVNESERPEGGYYEFWDNAETLEPYRIVTQDGSVAIFLTTTEGKDDDAATDLFVKMANGEPWDSDVMTCSDEEQAAENEPVILPTSGFVLPEMVSPMTDLDQGALQFYVSQLDETDAEWVDNSSASNAGWDVLSALSDGPLADFAEYARKSAFPLAMPDVCESFCPDLVTTVSAAARATEDICQTEGLSQLSACLFESAAPSVHACGKCPAAMVIQECEEASAARRLSGGDEIDEEGDFEEEEEEEDNMKVTTISSGALTRAADPQPPMPELSKLSDGSNSFGLDDLDAGTRAQIARALNMESLPKAGRIVFNATLPAPGSEIKNVEGLVDLPGDDSPTRRLMLIDLLCLSPGVGPGCIFSVWFPRSGPTCNPLTGSPPCKFSIAVKIQLYGPAAGALSVGGNGCIEAWKFSVPPPFDGGVCISGSITVNLAKSCGNKFPFTMGGYVSIYAHVSLNFGIFSFPLADIGVGAGAGIANYEVHCWEDRRRRRWWWGGTRRCNYACDFRVYGKAWRSFGFFKIWFQIEYWTQHKDWNLRIGIEACFMWWCSTVFSMKVF